MIARNALQRQIARAAFSHAITAFSGFPVTCYVHADLIQCEKEYRWASNVSITPCCMSAMCGRSADFIIEVLGFQAEAVRQPDRAGIYPGRRFGKRSRFGAVPARIWASSAPGCFSANNEPPAERRATGRAAYHLAWEVDSLEELERTSSPVGRTRYSRAGRGDHGVHKAFMVTIRTGCCSR